MRRILLLYLPCLALPHISHYLMSDTMFRNDVFENNVMFLILSTNLFVNVSFSKKNLSQSYLLYTFVLCNVPIILVLYNVPIILVLCNVPTVLVRM